MLRQQHDWVGGSRKYSVPHSLVSRLGGSEKLQNHVNVIHIWIVPYKTRSFYGPIISSVSVFETICLWIPLKYVTTTHYENYSEIVQKIEYSKDGKSHLACNLKKQSDAQFQDMLNFYCQH